MIIINDTKIQSRRMNSDYKYEVTFKNEDFSVDKLAKGDYECCAFQNCSFLGADLRSFKFIDTVFIDCDFLVLK